MTPTQIAAASFAVGFVCYPLASLAFGWADRLMDWLISRRRWP